MTNAPVLFLSHGAPPLADDSTWTRQLGSWGSTLTKPRAILIVSAHWEAAPATMSASSNQVGVVHDFWGFPKRYYDVQYPAPLAPELAERVSALLKNHGGVHRDETRGLDHGAYVPLVEMFPSADIPVLQLSMPTLDPARLLEFGRRLAPLRSEGVMIIGSGFTTHNLAWFNPGHSADAPAPTPSVEFAHWATEALASGSVDTLLDADRRAPAFQVAHPRSEHWAPLYVSLGATLGAGGSSFEATSTVDGFWYGLAKHSWQFN